MRRLPIIALLALASLPVGLPAAAQTLLQLAPGQAPIPVSQQALLLFAQGYNYEQGRNVPQDYVKAMETYRRAAAAGHPLAEFRIGYLYERGLGVKRDYDLARNCYQKAQKEGVPCHSAADPAAQCNATVSTLGLYSRRFPHESPMRKALLLTLLLLAGCGKPQPPVGKWEGGTVTGDTIVVARVEIGADGLVRVSAPDVTNLEGAKPEVQQNQRAELQANLVNGWDDVKPRVLDFDGKTFRKPGGVAPQMVWDKAANQMTLEIFIGARPALPVVLHPVPEFHDDPFEAG